MSAYYFVGVMTGTSVDAVDCALTCISANSFELLATHSQAIPESLRGRIQSLFSPSSDEIDRLGHVDLELAQLMASSVQALLRKAGIGADRIRALGCHGQTVRHRPPTQADARGFTLQIGDPNTLAELCKIDVVADFRRRDMALGGQGAPLVPAFHQSVFSHPETKRCVVNIGGIANISLLYPGEAVRGFDTGPGNALLDAWIARCTGKAYDDRGEWAAGGAVDPGLLASLHQHPYFARPAPKSTGREEFHLDWVDNLLAGLDFRPSDRDVQATLAELTALSIADALHGERLEVFVCGGGANNADLLARLRRALPNCTVDSSDKLGIDPQWVEASTFAWLAFRHVNGLSGNLPQVTGASRAAVLGALYPRP